MEQGSDAPKPEVLSNIFTPSSDIKPLKVKLLQLKGANEQLYSIIFNLFEKTIMIEASDINDVSNTKYLSNLSLENFHKINYYFHQFEKISEIFELL